MTELVNIIKLLLNWFVTALQCVAAFAVSAVASQWERTGKPFNPLLGETFEFTRLESEKPNVSHEEN